MRPPYPAIDDYALIGDCHTAALIARNASIDWFCPDRFDAPAVFCRLLDSERGGFLRTTPNGTYSVERRYDGSTNVLLTTFSGDGGRLRVTDLMPVHARKSDGHGYDVGSSHRILRRLECLDGALDIQLEFKPTFNYARAATGIDLRQHGVIAAADEQYLTLACTTDCDFTREEGTVWATVRLGAGEACWVVLTSADDPDRAEEALSPVNCDQQLTRTLQYWHQWADRCTYQGRYRDVVLRSALVLKLLTYEPTGAVVAAPTTSLPENVGGERNWDYRFTWLRDASLILYALLTIGYGEEAADFTHWLERTIGSDPTRRPQIMYGIDGRNQLTEYCLEHLSGYRDSRPVRVGNAAAEQRQLDIFGEVLRAAALHYRRGDEAADDGHALGARPRPPSNEDWSLLRDLVDRAAEHWDENGNGIWEVRGGPQPFLYGKLMCWAALDSGIRLAGEFHLDAPRDRWQKTRDEIRSAILQRGYDTSIGAFTQAFGSSALDATALVIPRIGFLPPTDPRVQSTVEQIRKRLSKDGLVYRYRTKDGLAGGEGTFTLCTFWLVDALALGGRLDEARKLFEHTLAYANDVGLLAEEIDPGARGLLGNFPQGFSHLALIGAAVNLAKAAAHGSEDEPETESDRASRASRAASAPPSEG
ncbi:MAG: glycoside hydrolase family 15 protein [Chloroflexi bacterium]|nr:glycoside hydrolase family 15 protein [Chloroflexota bacterium]